MAGGISGMLLWASESCWTLEMLPTVFPNLDILQARQPRE